MMHSLIEDFWKNLTGYYTDHGRHDMPWRQPEPDGTFDPYKILVSELMLQQTQVARVTPKYHVFLERFPTAGALAEASLADVLRMWNGLGFNRRAKYLWQAAGAASKSFPRTLAELQQLPGVGPNTAGAIMAYAYDEPVVFVETNIRTVIIHHFFADETAVSDKDIRATLEKVLATQPANGLTARVFYWAMMDYGAYLKRTVGNLNKASRSYSKQSAFHGSRRQVRGAVIRLLGERPYSRMELQEVLADERLDSVLKVLLDEQLIIEDKTGLHL